MLQPSPEEIAQNLLNLLCSGHLDADLASFPSDAAGLAVTALLPLCPTLSGYRCWPGTDFDILLAARGETMDRTRITRPDQWRQTGALSFGKGTQPSLAALADYGWNQARASTLLDRLERLLYCAHPRIGSVNGTLCMALGMFVLPTDTSAEAARTISEIRAFLSQSHAAPTQLNSVTRPSLIVSEPAHIFDHSADNMERNNEYRVVSIVWRI